MDNKYELQRQADKILAGAGLNIWGRENSRENYLQSRFESRMQTGAYRNNGERRR